MSVPLPLAEQHRLVAKLGQLLGHVDALEQRIGESRRLAGQLLQTALREALGGRGELRRNRSASSGRLPPWA